MMLSVYTRHHPDCAKKDDSNYRRCRCPKWLDGTLPGRTGRFRVSAKTKSWEQAELLAPVEYYFGDLQYWKLPGIAADALVEGYDGPALRSLAGLTNPVASDIRDNEVDSAFCEMGVAAPIAKSEALQILAIESAQRALDGRSNVFDEATYVRIHLCKLVDPPEVLKSVVNLSNEAKRSALRVETH